MGRMFERWTAALSAALVLGALLACKKREEPPAPFTATPPTAEPPKPPEPPKEQPKPKAKRYPDKEQLESGTIRLTAKEIKVYEDTDDTLPHVAVITKGTLVNRLARIPPHWYLIDYQTGENELSAGWVKSTTNFFRVEEKAKAEDVKKQDGGVVLTKPKADAGTTAAAKTDAGTKPPVKDAAAPTTAAKDASTTLPRIKLPPKK